MGYYIRTEASHFFIKKEHFQSCYKAMCKLNDYDSLKRGGGWGGEVSKEDPRPAGLNYHPARWFSWLDANYPETISTCDQLLMELGFNTEYDSDGNLIGVSYDDKKGQEDIFFAAIAPWVQDDSWIEWRGEGGDMFRWMFSGGQMKFQGPHIKWVDLEWEKMFSQYPSNMQLLECWSEGL